MTLKEKFTNSIVLPFEYEQKIQKSLVIADDYAINFVEWICKNYETDSIVFGILDTKELLGIYKKEKGL